MGSLASCGPGECEYSPQKRGIGRLRQICTGWHEQLCGALVKMSPRSVKSLRRLAKFRDARDFCRANAPQRQREQHTGSERVPWGVHESLLAFLAGFYLNSVEFYKTPLDNELYSFLTRSR